MCLLSLVREHPEMGHSKRRTAFSLGIKKLFPHSEINTSHPFQNPRHSARSRAPAALRYHGNILHCSKTDRPPLSVVSGAALELYKSGPRERYPCPLVELRICPAPCRAPGQIGFASGQLSDGPSLITPLHRSGRSPWSPAAVKTTRSSC
ncbi:hypothetical protein AAFF_G00114810 [Aldrovandia affinis]|uniref:Uncharacterized protein n=1 Tax=Aldrovandia affinis TaxID=143900 RepID=A0AAD7WAU1_9TELE|nr:hypothetical protein AAFF_G00114810 [Aldrovandia affinis]